MGIYENVKKACNNKGISINKLEQNLEFARSSISKFNTNVPSIEKMSLIAKELDVTVDFLMTGEEKVDEDHYYINDDAKEMAEFMHKNPEYKVLFDASRNVRKEDIEFVKQMLDRFRQN